MRRARTLLGLAHKTRELRDVEPTHGSLPCVMGAGSNRVARFVRDSPNAFATRADSLSVRSTSTLASLDLGSGGRRLCPSSDGEACFRNGGSGSSEVKAAGVMLQAAMGDGLSFDPFALGEDGLAAAEVDVGRGVEVVKALVVLVAVVVVRDEGMTCTSGSPGE